MTPGNPTYILGSPLFDRVTLKLPSGKSFVVEATDNGAGQDYIQTASLADQPLDRAWLQHHEIADGGTLHLTMGPEPNKSWPTANAARPP